MDKMEDITKESKRSGGGKRGRGLGAILPSRSRKSEQGQIVGAWAGSVCKEKGL